MFAIMRSRRWSVAAGTRAFAVLAAWRVLLAQSGTWSPRASIPDPRFAAAAGVVSGQIHVVGGGYPYADRHHIYDPGSNTWSAKAPFTPRGYGAGVGTGGKLYVVGGCVGTGDPTSPDCGGGTTALLQVYDPATDAWSTLPPMPTPRNSIGAAAIDGKLYVVGGEGPCPPCSAEYAALEIYDPGTNAWSTGQSMPTARNFPMVAAIGDRLYVSGGFTRPPGGGGDYIPSDALEVYDTLTGMWQTKAPLATPRGHGGAGVIDGRLHVVGGYSSPAGPIGVHEVYDPVANVWTSDTPVPTPRSSFAAAAIGTTFYAASGLGPGFQPTPVVEAFVAAESVTVSIDIRPGSANNKINLGAAGVIPVAILSTESFDAPVVVDPSTLFLAGASVRVAGRTDHWQCLNQDVNGDGRADLVCHFNNDLNAQQGDSIATLEGRTYTGTPIRGRDTIAIVP